MGEPLRTENPKPGGRPPTRIDEPERISESYADYLSDESRYGPPSADLLVFAHDEEQVAAVLTGAAESGTSVTVSGARTGIVGGAVPTGGMLLSLAEMNRVLGVRRTGDRVALVAEPGLSIAEIAELLESGSKALAPERFAPGAAEEVDALIGEESGYFYPPDPTEDTAHLGATVATNASGARSFRYGATRRHVGGVRVCLPTGEIVSIERGRHRVEAGRFDIESEAGTRTVNVPDYPMPATKNAAGYFVLPEMDVVDLFIGSEGTLGVVTEIEALLTPSPEGVLSALAFFECDSDAVTFVRHARGDFTDDPPPGAIAPMALEFFDSNAFDFLRARKADEGAASTIPELPDDARAGVLFEQEYTEETLLDIYEAWETLLAAHCSSMERTWGGMEESDLEKLKALRHGIAEQVNNVIARAKAEHPEIHKIGTDIAVPPGSLEEMFAFYRGSLADTGLEYVAFGHIGDSHVHLNIMPKDPEQLARAEALALAFAERAVSLGGTVSAEHGIGKLKHAFLRVMFGDEGLRKMAELKRTIDPRGILNRNVMFSEELLD